MSPRSIHVYPFSESVIRKIPPFPNAALIARRCGNTRSLGPHLRCGPKRTVGQAKLRAIRFRKRFGEQPQAIISDRIFESNTASWQEITNKVTQSGFWKLSITDNITGFDGSRWVLEAVRDGQYKVVDRWYPNEMTAERDLEGFKVLCVHILQLGDVLLKGERIY